MSTQTERDRLIALETQVKNITIQNTAEHTEIKTMMTAMSLKLDNAILSKADKTELDKLNSKLWAIAAGVIMAFLGLIVYMLQGHIK